MWASSALEEWYTNNKANAGYVFEITFCTLAILAIESFFLTICKSLGVEKKTSFPIEAVSHSRFGIFLYANLLTGLLFLVCDSKALSPALSLFTVIIYMVMVIGTFSYFYIKKISLKMW
jgi:hypothetical protein